MTRTLFDSPYIFGIHDPGGERHMIEMGKPGWIVFTEAIGAEPNDHSGKNFSEWSNQGLGVICRLNYSYEGRTPNGTLPHSSRYEQFAQRCAAYVQASQGCKIWIIGNEMNYAIERPGVQIDWARAPRAVQAADESSRGRLAPWRFSALNPTRSSRMAIIQPGEVITPALYARCYGLCRDAIHRVPGHADDQVLIGSVAPWNAQTTYESNPKGDWIQYFSDILKLLGPQGCDGITIHTYSRTPNPADLYNDQFMGAPFPQYQSGFRTYRDFMNAIPSSMRHLPVYITETDQNAPWADQNLGWVQRAYGEIDHWNRQPGNQNIRALILYRWPSIDQWVIEGRNNVVADFREAMKNDYRWHENTQVVLPRDFAMGDTVYITKEAYLRRAPGYLNKPQDDLLATLLPGVACRVRDAAQDVDELVWWPVTCTVNGQPASGWVAQKTPRGAVLLSKVKPELPAPVTPPPAGPVYAVGSTVWAADLLNLRRTPGFNQKPATDIVYAIPAGSALVIAGGPQSADGLTWWNVRFTSSQGNRFDGWVAGAKASGAALLATQAPVSPPVTPPITPPPVTPPPQPPVTPPVTPPIQPPVQPPTTPGSIKLQMTVITQEPVELRRSPGAKGKPADDVMLVVPARARLLVLEGPERADDRPWWRVRYTSAYGNPFLGWAAQRNIAGVAVLTPEEQITPGPGPTPITPPPPPVTPPPVTPPPVTPPKPPTPPPTPPPAAGFKTGDRVAAVGVVNLRRTPGFNQKPGNDILYEIPAGSTLVIQDGPRTVDGLVWWGVRFTSSFGNPFDGWVAGTRASGEALLTAQTGGQPAPEPTPGPPTPPPSGGQFQNGQRVYAATFLNLRRTPGYVNKTGEDVLVEAPLGASLTVLAGPQTADDLSWWQVRFASAGREPVDGWAAEASSTGVAYLLTTAPPAPVDTGPVSSKTFTVGQVIAQAYTDLINVRRTPGYQNKDASDVLFKLPPGAIASIGKGPQALDLLTWWRIAGVVNGVAVDGWVAEVGLRGERFLIPSQFKDLIRLGKPFEGTFNVTQLFSDRPAFYSQFKYDGVELRGHNGVDFGTPIGTAILATDDGEVATVGFEPKGFGNYVKLKHVWGESIYGHLYSPGVKEGVTVARGDVLGKSGNTGNSSGPHLHFGIRIHPNKRGDGWGGYCDPVPFMTPADVIVPKEIRLRGPVGNPPGMTPDEPGRERP